MKESYITNAEGRLDNYQLTCEKWRRIFLEMDQKELAERFGLEQDEEAFYIVFKHLCTNATHTGKFHCKMAVTNVYTLTTAVVCPHIFSAFIKELVNHHCFRHRILAKAALVEFIMRYSIKSFIIFYQIIY